MLKLNSLSEQPPEILREIGKHLDLPTLRNLRHTSYTFYTHYYQQQCDSLQKANRINSISAGRSHTLALTESGEVYSWGSNNHSQLGLGDTNDRLKPTALPPINTAATANLAKLKNPAQLRQSSLQQHSLFAAQTAPEVSAQNALQDAPSDTFSNATKLLK